MKFRERVNYHIRSRQAEQDTPIEQFKNPPLLWAYLIHIHDEFEKPIADIDGRKFTSELLDKYGEYEEFRKEYCGGDYTHHVYLKPPHSSRGND